MGVLLAAATGACVTRAPIAPAPPAAPALTAYARDLTRVTRDPRAESQPRISPDGRTLLVTVRNPDLPESAGFYAQFSVVQQDLVSGQRRLIADPAADGVFPPSPGTFLYADLGTPQPYFVWFEESTAQHRPIRAAIPVGDAQQPAFSPDGTRIVFNGFIDEIPTVCTINADGTNFTAHTPGVSPTWHPRKSLVVFDYPVDGVDQTFLFDLESGRRTQLTFGPAKHTFPVWSPDGAWLCVVSSRTGDSHLYIMRPNGSDLHPLTTGPARASHPHWARDGSIYFTSDAGAPTHQEKPFPWRWTYADIWRLVPVLPE